jgi:hypothetical protein
VQGLKWSGNISPAREVFRNKQHTRFGFGVKKPNESGMEFLVKTEVLVTSIFGHKVDSDSFVLRRPGVLFSG